MSAAASRHDFTDQRRLQELGYQPVQWRRPVALLPRNLIVLSADVPEVGLFADLLRGLRLTGRSLQVLPPSSKPAAGMDLILRFGDADADLSSKASVSLPAVSDLRGNPAAKRAAWAVLRAALR